MALVYFQNRLASMCSAIFFSARTTPKYVRLWLLGCSVIVTTFPASAQDNGIAVGAPKVFDNRTLTLLLDQFNNSLKNIPSFVNQNNNLNSALTNFQGSQQKDSATTLNLGASALKPSSPNASAVSSTQAPPALPDLPNSSSQSAPAFNPQFGQNASDLLSDQVNLQYQIFNLQMLQERALSDRLYHKDTRLQAVIGFNVSLDPHKQTRDSVAVVEITMSAPGGDEPVSLVAMMPQEKTYNTVALSTHSNAFGGSAVASMFTVGFNQRRRGQNFFVYRDNDTISFERNIRENADPNLLAEGETPVGEREVRFGWQFRPVLGRRSVSPGMRQMFAVISLPASDSRGAVKSEKRIKFTIRTYWKPYDRGTLTTKYEEPWSHYLSPASLFRTSQPGQSVQFFPSVRVPASANFEDSLKPIVDSVKWIPTGPQNGTIVITGNNFFTGTSVFLGAQKYATEADGLVIKSAQTMVLTTTVPAVATGDGVVYGRYGEAVPLQPSTPSMDPITIDGISVVPEGALFSELQITVHRNGDLRLVDTPFQNPYLVLYNDTPLVGANSVEEVAVPISPNSTQTKQKLRIHLIVPNSALGTKDGLVTVKFPFGGAAWQNKQAIYDPSEYNIIRLGGKDKASLLISDIGTTGFPGNWQIILDKTYLVDDPAPDSSADVIAVRPCHYDDANQTCRFIQVTAKSTTLDTFKKIVLLSSVSPPTILDIPSGSAPSSSPQIDKTNVITVKQNDAPAITFTGQGLAAVKRVSFNGAALDFSAKSDGSAITIFVSRDVSSKPGHVDLEIQIDQNTLLTGGLDVLPAPQAAGSPSPTQKGAQQQ